MIAALWRWLHPHDEEHRAVGERRTALIADTQRQAEITVRTADQLRQETRAARIDTQLERLTINELLAQMDKRRHDHEHSS